MKRLIPLAVAVIGVAALTAVAVLSVDRGPFERTPVGTEQVYWDAARQIASGGVGSVQLNAYPSPVYPRALALLASDDPEAPGRAHRVLTAIFLPLVALGVLALAWKRSGAWAAAGAAVLAAAAGPLVLSTGAFSPAVPAALLGLAALLVLDGKRNLVAWAVAGLLVGLCGRLDATLGWSLGLLLLVLALVSAGRAGSRRLPAVLLFLGLWVGGSGAVGALLGTSNVLPPVHGVDIYRGNRAEASGVEPQRGDHDPVAWWVRRDFTREAGRVENQRLTSAQVDRYWTGRAVSDTFTHPLSTLKRIGVKVLATFTGEPLPREVSAAFLRDRVEGAWLDVATWVGRILIPLGLVGLLLARRKAGGLLWAGALSGLLAALITTADTDTRQLTLIVLMAGFALFLAAAFTAPARTRIAAVAGGLAAVAVWGIWAPAGGVPGLGITGQDVFQLGSVYDREQRGSAALREYERSLRITPQNPYPRLALAAMLVRDHVNEQATRELESIRTDHPDFVPGLVALARLYEQQEDWRRAANVYGDLLKLDPVNPEYWNNLGTLDAQMGIYDQAALAFQRALQLSPNYEPAQENLNGLRQQGLVLGGGSAAPDTTGQPAPPDSLRIVQEKVLGLVQARDFEGAQKVLQDGYEHLGRRPELVYVDGTMHLVRGKYREAIRLFESVYPRMKQNPYFLNNLAAAYGSAGELKKAVATWKEALAIQPSNVRIQQSLARIQARIDSLEAK
jgi:tetratricopeptide (TPR) repeat protein